jgi:hypothetical protein
MEPRWVLAAATGRAHLDLGERSSESLKVLSEHTIVAACGAHIEAEAQLVSEAFRVRCSDCMRHARLVLSHTEPKTPPSS